MRTGAQQAAEDAKDTDAFVSFLRYFLLAFGVIALFVGAFVIFNSLSITIAQRTRELATLRTLGASRRQVRFSVIVESLVMGTLASIVGLFLGLALAIGLFKLFDAVGFTLPEQRPHLQHPDDHRLAAARDHRDADREHHARLQGDASAADRRRARGRVDRPGPVCPLPDADRRV